MGARGVAETRHAHAHECRFPAPGSRVLSRPRRHYELRVGDCCGEQWTARFDRYHCRLRQHASDLLLLPVIQRVVSLQAAIALLAAVPALVAQAPGPATLYGVVRDSATGMPLGGAEIMI